MPSFRQRGWLFLVPALLTACGSGQTGAFDLASEPPVPVDSYTVPSPEATPKPPRQKPTVRVKTNRPARKTTRERAGAAPVAATAPSNPLKAAEDEVVRLTNVARRAEGCEPLRIDERLRRAARLHSADMAARDYFSHDSLDGRSPWDRIEAAGYDYPAAENIARGQTTPRQVVQAWLDSPGHRANIVNCDLEAIGVGLKQGVDGPWWTQDFGYR